MKSPLGLEIIISFIKVILKFHFLSIFYKFEKKYITMRIPIFLNLILATLIINGYFLFNSKKAKASILSAPFTELSIQKTTPDTVYTKTVTSNVLLESQPFQGAKISYTLLDTTNNTQELIREDSTNVNGQDIADSLPVLSHFGGIKELEPSPYRNMIITNSGMGSNHLIRFTTNAKEVNKEAYIITMLGQQIATIPVTFNQATKTYDAIWKGDNEENGTYLFYTKSTNGRIASKIAHVKNVLSAIDYRASPINEPENEDGLKSAKSVTEDTLAASKFKIKITHEYLEDLIDTVLLKENTFSEFYFNVTSILFGNGNINGQIRFEGSSQGPSNADVEYKRFYNQSEIFATTAPNGIYDIQVPVVFEQSNPGKTKYIVTLSENGDPFITKIDTVLIKSGLNNLFHYVIQNTQPSDTVYSKIVTSNIILNAQGFEGANISYTLLDTITGSQQLIRESVTNSNGQDIVDSLPVLKAEEGLGASKYIISITHENLEDLIDTVLVKENTFHDFFFNTMGMQYEDGNVYGLIFYEDLTGQPNSANVEYKRLLNQSELFTTTATNGAYQLTVPVIFEPENPGKTKYLVTLTENGGDPFETQIDTVLISPETNFIEHYVNQILPPDPEQDIEGVVRNVYTKLLESGVTVRVINRETGELIEEDITGADGKYSFENIPQGTLVEFELGKPNELWMVNNEFDIPEEIVDTLLTFNRYFYPKTVEVPQVGTNTTFQGSGEEAAEMVILLILSQAGMPMS